MKGKYYCEMESPIYRQIIAEKLKIEGKQVKGTKKGKRCAVKWVGVIKKLSFIINLKGINFVPLIMNIKNGLEMPHQDLG